MSMQKLAQERDYLALTRPRALMALDRRFVRNNKELNVGNWHNSPQFTMEMHRFHLVVYLLLITDNFSILELIT